MAKEQRTEATAAEVEASIATIIGALSRRQSVVVARMEALDAQIKDLSFRHGALWNEDNRLARGIAALTNLRDGPCQPVAGIDKE